MNCLPLKPNLSCLPSLRNTHYPLLNVQQDIESQPKVLLLISISQALNVSLKNYEKQTIQNPQAAYKGQDQGLTTKEKCTTPERVIEIMTSEEDEADNLQPQFKQHQNKLSFLPSVIAEPNNSPVPQPSTDDEHLVQSKENTRRGITSATKKCRSRHEDRKNVFCVVVPEIDLIESAYLPKRGHNARNLASKRQQLLNRQVQRWHNQGKFKKEKREIRMLGN